MIVAQFLILLMIANGSPIVAKRLFELRFAFPLDGGVTFLDGQPLFGKSKTIRGLVVSVFATTLFAPLVGLSLKLGFLIGVSSMAGDLFSSFVKRRLNLPAGGMALFLDQIPESLFPLLVTAPLLRLSIFDMVLVIAIFLVGELVLSRILYKMHIRDHPY